MHLRFFFTSMTAKCTTNVRKKATRFLCSHWVKKGDACLRARVCACVYDINNTIIIQCFPSRTQKLYTSHHQLLPSPKPPLDWLFPPRRCVTCIHASYRPRVLIFFPLYTLICSSRSVMKSGTHNMGLVRWNKLRVLLHLLDIILSS